MSRCPLREQRPPSWSGYCLEHYMKLPKDWKIKELNEVAVVQTGLAKGKNHLKDPISLPYLRVANVQDGYLDLSEVKMIEVSKAEVERYRLKPNDVLMTGGGDFDKLGRGHIWRGQIDPCLHQNHIFVVRPKPEILKPEFLTALSASLYGKRYFLSCAKQSTNLASMNSTQLKHFPVPIPPMCEQEVIAEILGRLETKIEKSEQLIAAKTTFKRGLIQQLLSGKTGLKGFEKQKWKKMSLSDVCLGIGSRGTPDTNIPNYWGGTIPWITGADFEDQKIGTIRRFITQDAVAQSSTRICPKDSILLVSRTGVGKIALAPFEIAVSQDITALVLDQMKIYPLFGFYAIEMSIRHLMRFNQGTTINGVRQNDLRKLTIKIPSLEEQGSIVTILNACDREIDLLRRCLAELKKLKQGLMQKLLTGQIRIKVGNGESKS